MVQFLSIYFFFLDFFNFCWVFQKFTFFCVTLYITYVLSTQNATKISVLVTSSSYTNVVFKHKAFVQNVLRNEFKMELLCAHCGLSGEWMGARAGAGAGAGTGAGTGRRKVNIPPKNFTSALG